MILSWDLFIILFFVIMAVYGLLLGKERVFNILVNSFIGFVVASEVGDFVYTYLAKAAEISHSVSVSLFGAKVFAFVVVVFILTLRNELTGSTDSIGKSKFNTVLVSILAAGFILSSVMTFMGISERMDLFNLSNIAVLVYEYRLLWVLGLVGLVVANGILSKFKK